MDKTVINKRDTLAILVLLLVMVDAVTEETVKKRKRSVKYHSGPMLIIVSIFWGKDSFARRNDS